MIRLSKLLLSISILFCVLPLARGNQLSALRLYPKNGAAAGDFLGKAVASAGDVNGDGKNDFIVGASYADPGGISNAGSAHVYSGADGSLLYQKNGAAAGDGFGFAAAGAGDVNGDGMADFIIGARGTDAGGQSNAGSAYVYSGADGSLLYQKDGDYTGYFLGASVTGAGDVNGDGKDDFIIGAWQAGGMGLAYIYSGANGSLLYGKGGGGTGLFGLEVAGAGDVNGDGKADFIVGSSIADPGARSEAGSAWVYSGSDGSLLYRKDGAHTGDGLGYDVAGVGDVNGDGKDDFIIGAYAADAGLLGNAGSAYLFSGADGSLLYQKDGDTAQDFLGNSVAGAGDVNGDGTPDFIIGASLAEPGGLFDAGTAYLYSGADGSLLLQLDGAAANDQLGISVDGAGDLNGDGRSEIIVGAWRADPGGVVDAGSAFIFSLQARGDMNNDLQLTPADVVLTLTCVFQQSGSCDLAMYDLDCDGQLSPADVVLELNGVFLAAPLSPC